MARSIILQAIVIWLGTMGDFRVWYASRDPYHCIFRMIRLMAAKGGPMPVEQLRILDMFLMFPTLLHRLSLPAEMKERFRAQRIPPPADIFVKLPGTASIWQDLQIYQSTALKRMTGLGLLKRDALRESYANLEIDIVPETILKQAVAQNETGVSLMRFLINDVSTLPMAGSNGLIKRAGLPSRGPVI
jgi:hypothetical protein